MRIPAWINARSVSELRKATARVLCRAGAFKASRRRALFICYYRYVRNQSLFPKIGLIAVALCGVASWMFLHDARPLPFAGIAGIAAAYFLLLKAREAVLGLRVARGYFGSCDSEVRDIIKFLETLRSGSDFTDPPGGKRQPVLFPEWQCGSATRVVPIREIASRSLS